MTKIIDCRGLSCPEPIIKVRNELEGDLAEVLVSTATARDNIIRTVQKMGWNSRIEKNDDGFKLILHK